MREVLPLEPPTSGALNLYLGGRGYGESQVVVFPDGEVMVVDSCEDSAHHLPLDLLGAFDLGRVHLLVVTHADLDHCSGVKRLIEETNPERVWRFPAGSMSELLARVLRSNHPESAKLSKLRDALEALDSQVEQHSASFVNLNSASWSRADWRVECVAPCATDELAAFEQLTKLFAWSGDDVDLAERVSSYLLGPSSNPSERNNTLSLALSVQWNGRKILLCGDVEARHANRGWEGILRELERDQRLDIVRAPDVIKVAHHGSDAAFFRPAWAQHAPPPHTPLALLTAYQRGRESGRPPQESLLHQLTEWADSLGATASPVDADWARFVAAGWQPIDPTSASDGLEHWIGVTIPHGGPPTLHASSGVRWFARS